MAKAVSADARIIVKSGFLGMSKSLVYNTTNSTLKAYAPEYRIEEQKLLTSLINSSSDDLNAIANKVAQLKAIDFGQLKLEVAISEDKKFAAVQLFITDGFQFHPTADVKFFEGDDASIIASIV